jgi:hypothetical protein
MPTTAAAALPFQDQAEYRLLCQALSASLGGAMEGAADRGAAWHSAGWQELEDAGWQRLAALAEAQGIAPLLSHRLPPEAPAALRGRLQRSYYISAAGNALLIQELKYILKAFQQAGIPVVVLKGIDLAVDVYPDPALRVMTDLDVLIPYQYVPLAVRLLSRLGYQKMAENHAHHHVLLHGGPQHQVPLELHWSLVDAFHPATSGDHHAQEWFWQHTQPWPRQARLPAGSNPTAAGLAELGALALQPEANLLYLTAHLLQQHPGEGERLVWYYDLYLLLERQSAAGELDWMALLSQARLLGWDVLLDRALRALEERLAFPLPEGYLAARHALPPLEAGRAQAIPPAGERKPTRTRLVWRGLQAQPLPRRVRLLWDLFFPEPAYLRWRYRPSPAWLWPLYYPYRWFDILRDSIHTLVKPESPR